MSTKTTYIHIHIINREYRHISTMPIMPNNPILYTLRKTALFCSPVVGYHIEAKLKSLIER